MSPSRLAPDRVSTSSPASIFITASPRVLFSCAASFLDLQSFAICPNFLHFAHLKSDHLMMVPSLNLKCFFGSYFSWLAVTMPLYFSGFVVACDELLSFLCFLSFPVSFVSFLASVLSWDLDFGHLRCHAIWMAVA